MTSIVFGDRVVHATFREWGTGTVIKVESAVIKGDPAVRVTVRFNNSTSTFNEHLSLLHQFT